MTTTDKPAETTAETLDPDQETANLHASTTSRLVELAPITITVCADGFARCEGQPGVMVPIGNIESFVAGDIDKQSLIVETMAGHGVTVVYDSVSTPGLGEKSVKNARKC